MTSSDEPSNLLLVMVKFPVPFDPLRAFESGTSDLMFEISEFVTFML